MKSSIWKSRKFWIMVADVVTSLVTTLATWYLAPDATDKVITILGILQAPVAFLIGAIAYEDGKAMQYLSFRE